MPTLADMGWVIFLVFGYLCGSIPFGLLLTRWAGLGDVRSIGSGNIGATNVLRTGNKRIAALTLFCDVLKGFVPVFLATRFGGPHAEFAAGFGALAGHIFPVWLGFKGGKGVATGLGVLFGWSWMLGLVFCAAWLGVFLVTRISSASALGAALIAVAAGFMLHEPATGPIWIVAVLALVLWLTHRGNLVRLVKGEEPRSTFSNNT